MKLFIGYLALMNAAGFLSMLIDKRRAVRGRYRISERTLLLIAAAGGSVGSLAGMYLFRHKTLHKRFTIGIPLFLILQTAAVLIIASSFHAEAQKPSARVREHLEAIESGKEEDPAALFADDERFAGSDPAAAAEAAQLFFRPFSFEITDEAVSAESAIVHASLTTCDARALAHDICLQYATSAIRAESSAGKALPSNGYYALLCDLLSESDYDTVTSNASFFLKRSGHDWDLITGEAFYDQITGGFLSALADPYLLTPEELLTSVMTSFSALDAEGWSAYLQTDDLFATGSADYASEADLAFYTLLADSFSWKITDCQTAGDRADALLEITTVDLSSILASCHEKLLAYAATTDSITSDSQELADTIAQLLISSMEENAGTSVFPVTVTLFNDGSSWKISDLSALGNAILGNLSEALNQMRS